jgi:hypothetical protein
MARQHQAPDAGRPFLLGLVRTSEGNTVIRFLSVHMQELHHNRAYWLNRYERRRAIWLVICLIAVIAFGVFMWLVQR